MKQKTLLATAITAALMLQAWAVSAQDASPAPAQTTDSSAPSAAKAKKLESQRAISRSTSVNKARLQKVAERAKYLVKVEDEVKDEVDLSKCVVIDYFK